MAQKTARVVGFTGAIPEARWPELIALAERMPTEDLVYSNFGYNVAAMVIDVVRPEGWKRYLEQKVFLPAGMRDTYARVSGLDPKRIAKPHRFRADGRYTTRSHLSFLPKRRVGVVVMSSSGLSALTDIVAAFAYDLESGRSDARERAAARMAELRKRFADSRKNVATQDSVRAARQRQPLGRPLADFAGVYDEPAFGRIAFTMNNGRLEYRWGALYGPVEIYDAAKVQLRIETAGSGNVATFSFAGAGPAQSLELQGVTFRRTR